MKSASLIVATTQAMGKVLRQLQLRAIKRVHVKFDPFFPAVTSTRDFVYHVSMERARLTNPSCTFKTDVLNNREPPQIDITLINGKKYRLLPENLTSLEVLQQFDKICREHDPNPPEEAPSS